MDSKSSRKLRVVFHKFKHGEPQEENSHCKNYGV